MYLTDIVSSHFGEEKARRVYGDFKKALRKVVSIIREHASKDPLFVCFFFMFFVGARCRKILKRGTRSWSKSGRSRTPFFCLKRFPQALRSEWKYLSEEYQLLIISQKDYLVNEYSTIEIQNRSIGACAVYLSRLIIFTRNCRFAIFIHNKSLPVCSKVFMSSTLIPRWNSYFFSFSVNPRWRKCFSGFELILR